MIIPYVYQIVEAATGVFAVGLFALFVLWKMRPLAAVIVALVGGLPLVVACGILMSFCKPVLVAEARTTHKYCMYGDGRYFMKCRSVSLPLTGATVIALPNDAQYEVRRRSNFAITIVNDTDKPLTLGATFYGYGAAAKPQSAEIAPCSIAE